VGSGLNLKKRIPFGRASAPWVASLGEYFNKSELIRNPRPIHAALLKYGFPAEKISIWKF